MRREISFPKHPLNVFQYNKAMQKIIFLKGIPGSGKTTWAKQYIIENSSVERINKDDIREEFGNPPWSSSFEKMILEEERKRGLNILEKGFSLIVDDTNFHSKHYLYWENIAKKYGYELEEKVFDTPLEECIERDSKRQKSVGESVIRKMYKSYVSGPKLVKFDSRKILLQDKELPKAIICDLDGTIALMNGRTPYDDSKIETDVVNYQVKQILDNYIKLGIKVIYVTGRAGSPECKQNTINWLTKNNLLYENSKLLFRQDKDYRPDSIVKKEIYENHIKDIYFVEFVLDDRDSVVAMWRDLGLLCLQVYYGNF